MLRNNKNRKYKKGSAVDTGDFGSEKANDANLASGNKSVGYGGADGDPRTNTNQVNVKTGPAKLPVVGPLTAGFNFISKNLYNQKNLKDARKNDLLSGEMLTTGTLQTKNATLDRGENTQLCPDGTYPPCKTPATQTYDSGGEIVISSNVDKNLL